MSVGSRIKKLRTENKITQDTLAKILNIGKSTISQYENNVNKPDIDMLKKIAEYFGVSLDWLMCRTDTRNVTEKLLDEKIAKIIEGLGSDVTHKLCELEDMTPEEKKTLVVFLEGLAARRKSK